MSANDLIIITTAVLVAGSTGLLGTFLVLRKMSMLGDAISHAVLPGIAIAYLLTDSRDILPMFIGAAAFGLLTSVLIETIHRRWQVPSDAAIGIIFTALFAFGVLLISQYSGRIDLDQECVLYGEIAFTPFDTLLVGGSNWGPRPLWILTPVFILNVVFIVAFYKELKLTSFDPSMATALGINATLVHYLLMTATSVTTVASFESVGAILVVALIIVPGATAYLWTEKLQSMLILSVVFGIIAAVLGYYLSGFWDTSVAGMMSVVLGVVFVLSLYFSPRKGIFGKMLQQ